MRSLPTALVWKEGRALAPIWLAATATIIGSSATGEPVIGLLGFVVGGVALGTYSIGHEYAHRTLTSLLAQPLSRSRLMLSKGIVLGTLLALLTLVAAFSLLPVDAFDTWRGSPAAARWWVWFVALTPVLGLCIAPWLTTLSRSVMGGLVFTLAVPAGLWIAGQIARVATVGFTADELEYSPGLTLMIVGLLVSSAIAIVHGRALWLGLEALETPREIGRSWRRNSTAVDTDAPPRRRHPVVALVQKEIRLHTLAVVVAALYALVWIAMRLTRMDAYIAGQSFEGIGAAYGLFIAMMVGALACAEERALGTTDWQILQPWAHWKQWTVKAATVVGIALTLGLAVPILLEELFPLIGDAGHAGLRSLGRLLNYYGYASGFPLAIPFVALVSIYISTLCTGGLRALLLTMPLLFGLATIHLRLLYLTYNIEQRMLSAVYGANPYPFMWRLRTVTPEDTRLVILAENWFATFALVGFLVMTLGFTLRNSRSAERGTVIARRQLPWVLTYVALASVLSHGVPAYLQWWLFTH